MSDISTEEAKGCVHVFFGIVPMTAYQLFAEGFVISKLWGWYAVPLGVRPLHWHTCAVAVGVYNFVTFRMRLHKATKSELEQAGELFAALSWPWIVLLLGWWWL